MADWAKKITGKPTITVSSVGLSKDSNGATNSLDENEVVSLGRLSKRMQNNEFDLAAVGRGLLTDANWAAKVEVGRLQDVNAFSSSKLAELD